MTDYDLILKLKNNIENNIDDNYNTLTEAVQALKDEQFGKEFEIWNKDDLIEFAELVNSGRTHLNAKLMDNIDTPVASTKNPKIYWVQSTSSGMIVNNSIGTLEHPYQGTFDGQNFSIKLKIDFYNKIDKTAPYFQLGLFNTINKASIKNLTIEGSIEIKGSGTTYEVDTEAQKKNKSYIGCLSARAYNSNIENCFNKTTIQASFYQSPNPTTGEIYDYPKYYTYIGGLIGFANNIKIFKCGNEADFYIPSYWMGGIVGYLEESISPSRIEECYNHGQFIGYRYSGGLIGYLGGCSFETEQEKNNYEFSINFGQDINQAIFLDVTNSENMQENAAFPPTLGCPDGLLMTEEEKQQYKKFTNNLKRINAKWSINEDISKFQNQYYKKTLEFAGDLWQGLKYQPCYYEKGNNPDRCILSFNIEDENIVEGYYQLKIIGKNNKKSGTIRFDESFKTQYYNLYKNENELQDFVIDNIYLYLKPGKNILNLYAVLDPNGNYGSQRNTEIYLNTFEFKQLNSKELIFNKKLEIPLQNNPDILNKKESLVIYNYTDEENIVSASLRIRGNIPEENPTDQWNFVNLIIEPHNVGSGLIKILAPNNNDNTVLDELYEIVINVVDEKDSKYTTIIKNCYNTGNFGSQKASIKNDNDEEIPRYTQHSAGLFGTVASNSSFITTCFNSGESLPQGSNLKNYAIASSCNSTMVYSFHNIHALKNNTQIITNIDTAYGNDDHYEDMDLSLQYSALMEHPHFCDILNGSNIFICADKYPCFRWEYKKLSLEEYFSNTGSYNNSYLEDGPY